MPCYHIPAHVTEQTPEEPMYCRLLDLPLCLLTPSLYWNFLFTNIVLPVQCEWRVYTGTDIFI